MGWVSLAESFSQMCGQGLLFLIKVFFAEQLVYQFMQLPHWGEKYCTIAREWDYWCISLHFSESRKLKISYLLYASLWCLIFKFFFHLVIHSYCLIQPLFLLNNIEMLWIFVPSKLALIEVVLISAVEPWLKLVVLLPVEGPYL